MKILVIAPSWIGDCVAAQPLFMRLHEKYEGLQLDVMAPAYVAPVFRRMAQVADILDNPFGHGETRLSDRWQVGRALTKAGYAQAIVLPNSLKSALVPFFARIPKRIGFVGEGRWGLLNRLHRLDPAALPRMVERYAQLAEEPGTPLRRPLPQPRLVTAEEKRRATLAGAGLDPRKPVVSFCPGAEYGPAKRWPPAYFADLARQLAVRGYEVWLLGSHKDASIGAEIAAGAPDGCRDLCGRTTLDQAVDLLASSAFVVTNDSGLMHVAAALDRPQIALFGSSSPEHTPPLSPRAQVMWLKLECAPCFKRECPLGHFSCMRALTPASVLERIESSLTPRQAFGNIAAAPLPSSQPD